MPNSTFLLPGTVLENRYRINRILGEGGFGRAYLSEDLNRFKEACVLKEFAPQMHDQETLAKARELFQREAGVLYQLRHPQIPEFRELLQVDGPMGSRLFLVQQYAEGPTYWQVIKQGRSFGEPEAIQLLRDLLPVLAYIHDRGVIHRDISPDNLVCQIGTRKPVLIDFGGVKQIALSAMNQLNGQAVSTQLFKQGYTPPEQIRGMPGPTSDLYALAVTVLVLMTGRPPTEFYDAYNNGWAWRSLVQVSPGFQALLEKMLADRVVDRYPSASAILQVLGDPNTANRSSTAAIIPSAPLNKLETAVNHSLSRMQTWVVSPQRQPTHPTTTRAGTEPRSARSDEAELADEPSSGSFWAGLTAVFTLCFYMLKGLVWAVFKILQGIWWVLNALVTGVEFIFRTIKVVIALAVLSIIVALFLIGRSYVTQQRLPQIPSWVKTIKWPSIKRPSPNSQSCSQQLIARYTSLNIPAETLYPLVNDRFYQRYPALKGRPLTDKPEDARLRQAWCQIAQQVLTDLEKQRP